MQGFAGISSRYGRTGRVQQSATQDDWLYIILGMFIRDDLSFCLHSMCPKSPGSRDDFPEGDIYAAKSTSFRWPTSGTESRGALVQTHSLQNTEEAE